MNRFHALSAVAGLLAGSLLFAGCSGNSTETGQTPPTTGDGGKPFKVGMLLSGDINDQGWNQLGYESLQEVEKENHAQVTHQITKSESDYQPALRDFGDQKYDLVYCYGGEYENAVKQVAPAFPDTKFVIVAGNLKQEPNVAAIIPKLEEGTYLLGMLAGGMSKNGKIGMIGGKNFNSIQCTFDAFGLGAKATNPKAQVFKPVYVGSFEDQNAGKVAATSLIAQGADFLIHNADQAGNGMFAAAKESKGVLVFGTNRDQNAVAPDVTLASAVIEMRKAFVDVAKDVQANKFKAQLYELSLANGDISIHWNDKLKSKVPPALMKKVEDAQKQIQSGKLKIKHNA